VHQGVRAFADHLAAAGWLDGADPGRAADECWVLTSPSIYLQLTGARQWSDAAYQEWLARTLAATLLRPPEPPS
jgi:hypothetical protein